MTLSDKEHSGSMLAQYSSYFYKEDVKESIKKLKKIFKNKWRDYLYKNEFFGTKIIDEIIDEVMGDKLI